MTLRNSCKMLQWFIWQPSKFQFQGPWAKFARFSAKQCANWSLQMRVRCHLKSLISPHPLPGFLMPLHHQSPLPVHFPCAQQAQGKGKLIWYQYWCLESEGSLTPIFKPSCCQKRSQNNQDEHQSKSMRQTLKRGGRNKRRLRLQKTQPCCLLPRKRKGKWVTRQLLVLNKLQTRSIKSTEHQ